MSDVQSEYTPYQPIVLQEPLDAPKNIVVFSDLHMGRKEETPGKCWEFINQQIASKKCDVLVCNGDLGDYREKKTPKEIGGLDAYIREKITTLMDQYPQLQFRMVYGNNEKVENAQDLYEELAEK